MAGKAMGVVESEDIETAGADPGPDSALLCIAPDKLGKGFIELTPNSPKCSTESPILWRMF